MQKNAKQPNKKPTLDGFSYFDFIIAFGITFLV